MRRALQLAKLGAYHAAPNPLVGCVLVKNHQVIGEGWHAQCGKQHAEQMALQACPAGEAANATAYVTLEPCAHQGKTPPCTQALIQANIAKVVIATPDPHPVSQQGIQTLKNAGIAVVVGCCEAEARWLNRRFFTSTQQQRPYVIVKWAQSADGYLQGPTQERTYLTGRKTQSLVHQWRSREQAILIGRKTAEQDDPQLTVRYGGGHNPIPIIITEKGNIKPIQLLQNPLLQVYTKQLSSPYSHVHDLIAGTLQALHAQNIQSIMVEGGRHTIQAFLQTTCWDEVRLLQSPHCLQAGIKAPSLPAHVQHIHTQFVADDIISTYISPHNMGALPHAASSPSSWEKGSAWSKHASQSNHFVYF